MRISGLENNHTTLSNQPLDAKILLLIEKLASQPLLIEKLILAEQQPLTLIFSGKTPLKQLELPTTIAKRLSGLTQSPMAVKVLVSNNQVIVNLVPQDAGAAVHSGLKFVWSSGVNLFRCSTLNTSGSNQRITEYHCT